MSAGALVLVATPIGNLGDVSARAVDALRDADVVACEDTRHTRKLLAHVGVHPTRLVAVHQHNEAAQAQSLVRQIAAGAVVAFVTDAGMPAVSDPGERLVRAAIEAELEVRVVPGPSAALAALVVSGLPTSRFCFEGFLPRKGRERAVRLAALAVDERTMVVFEAPHRLEATLRDLARALGDDRRVALARELTKRFEEVRRGTLADAVEWAAQGLRGEVVLVVEGAAPVDATPSDVAGALRAALGRGVGKRDAIAQVAQALGAPKREVYRAALALEEKERSDDG